MHRLAREFVHPPALHAAAAAAVMVAAATAAVIVVVIVSVIDAVVRFITIIVGVSGPVLAYALRPFRTQTVCSGGLLLPLPFLLVQVLTPTAVQPSLLCALVRPAGRRDAAALGSQRRQLFLERSQLPLYRVARRGSRSTYTRAHANQGAPHIRPSFTHVNLTTCNINTRE
jgi:hypothetical protein